MVQRVGAQYMVKKISDYVMAPPAPAETEAVEKVAASAPAAPSLDGQTITDEHGQPLGIARRVADVQVYLITDQRRGLGEQLEQTIVDPEMRVYFHHDDQGRLTGLIYVPDRSKRPAGVSASRADDI
jgi:hypothetical protein